jgi:hypothetical protein
MPLKHLDIELVFAAKMIIDRSDVAVGLGGYVSDTGVGKTAFTEQFLGCIKQSISHIFH